MAAADMAKTFDKLIADLDNRIQGDPMPDTFNADEAIRNFRKAIKG